MNHEKPVAKSFAKSGAKSLAHKEVPILPTEQAKGAGRRTSGPENRQTRLHKGATPPYVPPRPDIGELARRLTDRDRAILRVLARHRVFTSTQLTEMFFNSEKRALGRLLELHRMTALDRFMPYRPGWGSSPYHYVLGRLGAAVVASARGDEGAPARRWRPDRSIMLSPTPRLERLVGLNGFCAALVGHARRHPGSQLLDWMTEAEVGSWVDRIVAPHAYGKWSEDGATVEFFVEYDRDETVTGLRARLDRYAELECERGACAWVLFAFASARREATVRAAVAGTTVPVATAATSHPMRPDVGLWWPLGGERRLALAQLAYKPVPPEAAQRVAPDKARRPWFFDRSPATKAGRTYEPEAGL